MNNITVPYQFEVLWKKFEKRDGPVSEYENFEYTHHVCGGLRSRSIDDLFSFVCTNKKQNERL